MARAKVNQGPKGERQQRGERQKEDPQQSSQAVQTTDERGGKQGNISRREQNANPLWTNSPFTLMRRFGEEMDRLFGDFGTGRVGLTPSFGRELDRLGQIGSSIWSP